MEEMVKGEEDLGRVTDRYGFFDTDKFHLAYAGEISEAEVKSRRDLDVSFEKPTPLSRCLTSMS